MEEQTKNLQDYLVTLYKRKTAILSISLSVLVLSAAIAFLLPPVYKSSATILIEQQEIPPELVMSTVTSYAAERIQTIQARIMSRTNLLEIVEKFNLYEDERVYETTEEIMERMNEDVALEIISADVVDPRTGRPSVATIAFLLSYNSKSPGKAQKVASELTSLYLNENLKSRTQKAEDTSIFFKEEIDRLSITISELESKLAKFKQENADALPELQRLNLEMLQRTESEVRSIETQLRSLEERRFYLQGQLAQIQPENPAIPGPELRLKQLEAEYAVVVSRYSDEHPDVQRLKREVDSLRRETGRSDSVEAIAEQLISLRAELAQMKERYTPEHPDIVSLEEKITSLNNELELSKNRAEDGYFKSQPDNPAYITLKAQLAGIESEIKALKEQRSEVNEKFKSIEERLYKAPQVEREYLELRRGYENAVVRYQETKAKQMQADIAKQLESESKGERFTLIDPPALPEEPISPNRPVILFLGFVLSLGSGIGFAFVADAISGAVRGVKSIETILGVSPLAVLPYQLNLSDMENRKKYRKRVILIGIASLLALLLIVHFLVSPIDVLWFRILRKIDILTS